MVLEAASDSNEGRLWNVVTSSGVATVGLRRWSETPHGPQRQCMPPRASSVHALIAFRHTLATEVLELGGTFEDAADILGDSEAIVRKHYAKWSARRQARISDLLARIGYAKKPHPQTEENEGGNLVDLVRFELTTSSMPWKRAPNCATGPLTEINWTCPALTRSVFRMPGE